MIMLIIAIIFYVFMCWISNWNLLWPLEMISRGGLGDWLLVICWVIMLIAGINLS